MVAKGLVVFSTLLITFLAQKCAYGAAPPSHLEKSHTVLKPALESFILRQEALEEVLGQGEAGRVQWLQQMQRAPAPEQLMPKSKPRAFFQSLLLPGWGQHYAESKTMTKVFVATEVVLWGTFLGFNVWENWLEDDFQTFAATHANVNLAGKPDRYFVDIGNFDSIFEFNQAQLRNRDVTTLYPETEEFFWQWDSQANRREFEDMRIRRDRASNRAEFSLAAIFLNHFVSAIHSTLAVHQFNKRLEKEQLGLKINLDLRPENTAAWFRVSKHF